MNAGSHARLIIRLGIKLPSIVSCALRMALLSSVLAAGTSYAQTWPDKPIHLLVPFAPGGTVDIVARANGKRLGEELGQPFVIENKAGAGGTIAATIVAKSPPDGYTLMLMHQGLAFNAALYPSLPYDTVHDLAPIASIGATPNALVVTNSFAVQTPQEFVAYARANPGKVTFGSGGIGSAGHLSMELLQSLTGIQLAHVPYKGSGPALLGLMTGEIQSMLLTMPAVMPYLKSKRMRAIGTSGIARSPALPTLPTLAESGVAGYEYLPWFGMFGPAAMPPSAVKRLNIAINKIIVEPAIRDQFAQQGLEVQPLSPDQFAEIVKADVVKWGRIIRTAGVRAD